MIDWGQVKTKEDKVEEELESQRLAKELEYKKYLTDTDWYYTRKTETGKDVPADVLAKRIEYREWLNG